MKTTPPDKSAWSDFGYQEVPIAAKTERVRQVFDSVASQYDWMNDLMSLGLHRLWKRWAVALSAVRSGAQVLDLAGGTGDLTRLLARQVGPSGRVILSDINQAMLKVGRDRLLDQGQLVPLVQCNAEKLPFASNFFSAVTIGFGLRNVTHKEQALAEMYRVLRPGGLALILEFSQVWEPLRWVYDQYSFRLLPWLGQKIVGDSSSYQYLVESIRRHPNQETLADMLKKAGFEKVDYHNLAAGIVAIHRGWKF